jgi:hypothetical protein|tara:strand:+ start:27 stop:209 length:183 start_codon:yes stop_codon:yes gene_type:complete
MSIEVTRKELTRFKNTYEGDMYRDKVTMQVTFLSDDNVAISFGEYTNGYEECLKLIRRSI